MGVLIIGGVMLAMALPARAEVTPQQVQDAIAKAKDYLYSQEKDGNWENVPAPNPGAGVGENGGNWGGRTALATLALVVAGEKPNDPRIDQAVKFNVAAEIKGIYALGIHAQLLAILPQSQDVHDAEKKDFKLLRNALGDGKVGNEDTTGFYAYLITGGFYHHSPSQFGVLGMWQLSEAGVEVSDSYWQTIDKAWRRTQTAAGNWNYRLEPDDPKSMPNSRESMTAGGVATLFITKTMLGLGAPIDCNTPPAPDEALEKGLKYLGDHFKDIMATPFPYYTWYGIERIGLASGRRNIGTNDWYQAGVETMLKNPPNDVINTSFMLLFLSRGSAPIVMQKLQYKAKDPAKGPPGSGNVLWDQRPRDVANLTNWMIREFDNTTVAWQSVDISAREEDFHDAPIVFISGSTDPIFTEAEKAKLRQYVEEGGLIVGNANCNSPAFKAAFIKLGKELFPKYEFRNLPPRHPILINEEFPFAAGKPHPDVTGISNEVRELMLLVDGDPAAAWQGQAKSTKKSSFQIATNIYLYASGSASDLRRRGETYFVRLSPTAHPAQQFRMARIQYQGNWDPEPAGWKRLAAMLQNADKLKLDVDTVELGKGDLSAYKFAHLTGTAAVKFNQTELDAIKAYVNGGGTLLIDAAGGSSAFVTTVSEQLRKLFAAELAGEDSIPMLGDNDPIYTAGTPLKAMYRAYVRKVGNFRSWREPHLRAIKVANRNAVYFSEEDLSAGLVGVTDDGINGYRPDTAVDLATRIVMSIVNAPAASSTTKPATMPTTAATIMPTK